MAVLELVQRQPDWYSALHVALTLPPGMSERRGQEDPWNPAPIDRPRRISDDLAWFRQAVDDPEDHGLQAVDANLPGAWEAGEDREVLDRLFRLEQRGVLRAAGFVFHRRDGATQRGARAGG